MTTTSNGTEISKKDYDLVSQLLRKGNFSDDELSKGLQNIKEYRMLLNMVSFNAQIIPQYLKEEQEYCFHRWKCTNNCLDMNQHKEFLAKFVLEQELKCPTKMEHNNSYALGLVLEDKNICKAFSF